jgi:hypothetical protein
MSANESLLSPEERDLVEHPKRHNLEPFRDSDKTRVLRFWLNIIFMVGAIVGLVTYFYYSQDVAFYILVVASAFKFIELALRIFKI